MRIVKSSKCKIKSSSLKFKVIFLFAVIVLSGCSAVIEQPINESRKKHSTVLQIDFGNDTIVTSYQLPITSYENQYLWPVMKQVLEKNDVFFDVQDYGGDLGVFIKQIGDKKNGEDNKYWQYFVNGEYATLGASNYRLQPGDLIEWKFVN